MMNSNRGKPKWKKRRSRNCWEVNSIALLWIFLYFFHSGLGYVERNGVESDSVSSSFTAARTFVKVATAIYPSAFQTMQDLETDIVDSV